MKILLIRYDADGNTFYVAYDTDPASAQLMATAVREHLNTPGVTKLELIPVQRMGQ